MTRRILLRPLLVGSLAVLFGLYLALGASPAFAQVEGLLPEGEQPAPEGEVPEGETPEGGLLDGVLEGGSLEELLQDLSLDELLNLLDLLGEESPEGPAPVPAAQPAPVPATPTATQASPQVAQRPVGGVATGAGGTDNGGTTAPLLALGALTLAGAAAGVTRTRRTGTV